MRAPAIRQPSRIKSETGCRRSTVCVRGGGVGPMKRVVLALCLAAITAAAQAQSSGDHVRKPSRHLSAAAQKPTPVSALLKWLKDKAKANADKTKATSADVSVRRQAV